MVRLVLAYLAMLTLAGCASGPAPEAPTHPMHGATFYDPPRF